MESLIIMKDEDILNGLKQGDNKAWNMMVDRYSKNIYNMALNFAGNSDDASDITQDIFLKIFNNIQKFKADKNFGSWVMKLSKNHCIDYWRKNKRMLEKVELNENLSHNDKTPEDSALKADQNQNLRNKLLLLKPDSRLLIIMRDIQDYSYLEIADHFNIPLGTTKSRINRARAQLAKHMINKGQ